MPEPTTLDERLRAVERTVTDDAIAVADLDDAAALTARLDALEDRLDAMDARLDEVDAAVTAVRGYVGQIGHVNAEVERTATAALAAVDRLDEATGTPPALARVARDESVTVPDPLPDADADADADATRSPSLLARLLAHL